jgi:hypothetical protein
MAEQPHSSSSSTRKRKATDFFWDLLIDDESEEDEEDAFVVALASAAVASSLSDDTTPRKRQRPSFFVRDRIEWDLHVAELIDEGPHAFPRMYRMSHEAFVKLCSYIDSYCRVDPIMSIRRSTKGPIVTEIALHCLLRWLGGGSYLDIRISAGISVSSFYVCIHKCMNAILLCDALSFSMPITEEDLNRASEEFESISFNSVIDGCVGCLDGFLLTIQTPPKSQTGNVKAYFSGHYQCYGINVQAVCDSKCRFISVSVAAPGGSNDIAAFRKTRLHSMLEELPIGKYIIGDNAYICSEHLLTPFSGDQRNDARKDAFNFYLSQVRIRIEMAFGLLTTKWRILRRPLQVKLKYAGKVLLCVTRLHNFCINEREFQVDPAGGPAGPPAGYVDDDDNDDDEDETPASFLPSDVTVTNIAGNSMMRDLLLDKITNMALCRPQYNVARNVDV